MTDIVNEIMLYGLSRECPDCDCRERKEGCACWCHAQFCDCHGAPIALCKRAMETDVSA